MKQSHLFTKTRKEAPTDEQAKNAQLLIRAGFIHKEMAGVYTFLPLGLRVFENIKQIIRCIARYFFNLLAIVFQYRT